MLRLLLTLSVGLSIGFVLPEGAMAAAKAARPASAATGTRQANASASPATGTRSAKAATSEATETRPAKASASAAKGGKAKTAKRRTRRGRSTGWVVKESELRAIPPAPPSGELRIHAVNFHEEIAVNIYNPDGSYSLEAARTIAHVFRCRRTGEEHEIEPRLLTLLSHVYDHFGGKRIELLSGYRHQRRKSSYHFRGAAADIRVAGVSARELRGFVDSLDAGGMGLGLYPRVGFIHVDVRPEPSYRWVDYSRSNPDARDKQPPRGWKRRKLES